jgi:hypothetical protein
MEDGGWNKRIDDEEGKKKRKRTSNTTKADTSSPNQ